jgi:hypothetical protein
MEARREEAPLKATGFAVLTAALDACIEAGLLAEGTDTTRLATQMWSMVHGVVTLELNRMLDVFDTGVTGEQLVNDATRMMFRGLRNADDLIDPLHQDEQMSLSLI